MKYKAGDKVVIRHDLEDGKEYGTARFLGDMSVYKGTVQTVEKVILDVYWERKYVLDIRELCFWNDELIDHAATEKLNSLENIKEQQAKNKDRGSGNGGFKERNQDVNRLWRDKGAGILYGKIQG